MPKFLKKEAFLFASFFLSLGMLKAGIRAASGGSENMTPSSSRAAEPAETAPAEAAAPAQTQPDAGSETDEIPPEAMQAAKPARATGTVVNQEPSTRANAFIAAADWEFDGFVAGGQDSNVRSMFYLNDLLYLNIGSQQGIVKGDRLEIFKRGDKVRDPQNGRFIGYEVRRAAVVVATDRVENDACAVRIIRTHEPVEIGDLVRRVQ